MANQLGCAYAYAVFGTTGAGKTEGLKSLISNAFCWSSGFVYVDGKAQNTLWGDVYSLARRFGRDDDVLVLNYMTGNSDNSSRSNSLNPFSIGSASYLTQMMVGLMDDSGDDGGMWKGRAISLMSALMPALTWRRDNQGLMLDVGVIRDNLTMQQIIKMSRDPALPDRVIRGLQSYLDTLPGYVDNAFDDDGNERPPDPNQPMVDLSQTRQQHGYLTMQFTRALSSLADEYGYIFKQQMADIDMMDVVLNRRILVVLIPALEKSPDEAANLGKIVVAALKGMMGATLGAELEGEQSAIIDNNPTTSSTPFMTVFDEVGYYTSPGMGVMAAQARSLGFSLIFAGQDMPALQKRVKEEALSIAGNCNLKIFGKLEDPTETKDFFEKTVSSALVSEASGFSATQGVGGRSYHEGDSITFQARKEASYDDLRRQTQGQVHFLWADKTIAANMFYSNPKRVNVVRVQRMIGVSPRNWAVEARDRAIGEVTAHLRDENWMAGNGAPAPVSPELSEILDIAAKMREAASEKEPAQVAALAVGQLMAVGKKRLTEAVSVPGVGTTAQQGHWPFGGAGDVAQIPGTAAPPPGAPSSPPPPWLANAA
jgi:intracellular multiplication protein IcmO